MSYRILERKMLPHSQIEFVIELDVASITSEEVHVLEDAARNLELPGFRKGKVPKEMIRTRMGALALFEDAATAALSHALGEIFRGESLDVIGRPAVGVQKLAPGNPAVFTVTCSLFPRLTLPDYKTIAAKENKKPDKEPTVEEKDIDAVIAEIVKERNAHTGKKEFQLTNETVRELGEFTSAADLRSKVSEGLMTHRKDREREKRRATLLDAIAAGTKGDIPDVLIENELARLEADFSMQIERLGSTFDAYLGEIKKSREDVRKEWRPDAGKRARLHLALAEIARAEKIVAPPEEVGAEVKRILAHYKNAREETARLFVENTILNQKTIEFLEKL
jgi:FKBP-type peptidyl-prolyl cis-trans isomerase (trigger factor)